MGEAVSVVHDVPKTFLDHLGELRGRIVISALAILAGTVASFFLRQRLFDLSNGLFTLPLRIGSTDIIITLLSFFSRIGIGDSMTELFQLYLRSRASEASAITLFAATPMEKFMVVFKASFIVGIIISAPIVLYQAWAFVLPALKHGERKYLMPLFFITLFFFFIGATFAFFIVTPISIPILAGFLPSIQNQWRIKAISHLLLGLFWLLALPLSFLLLWDSLQESVSSTPNSLEKRERSPSWSFL